jgi:nicotinic acid phosphoribosyltransferase
MSVLTDSYKAGHVEQYPAAKKMVAYGEFRQAYNKGDDDRFVFWGSRYFVSQYLSHRWTEEDLDLAGKFYATHNAGYTPFPWPKDLFHKFVKENNGYFPVKLEFLPEGTCAHIHTPVYIITAEGEWSRLVTFLETMLTHIWYPSTVATLSRLARDVIEDAFEQSVDGDEYWKIDSRLHDFGFRGCTCLEQSILGGTAHLLNFSGSDTMSACYYAQYTLNNGKPVATSIPATEHSVMTAWSTESAAIRNMFNKYGEGVAFATVMDSYDYTHAMEKIVPALYPEKHKNSMWVLRPDSGDPVEVILQALKAGEEAAGVVVNKKKFKVIQGINAIQGDGIGLPEIKLICEKTIEAGFAVSNVAFGMGSGLLQKLNRDTMSFATKLCYICYEDGTPRNVMKKPKTDGGKTSLPGMLKVVRENGIPTVLPLKEGEVDPNSIMQVVWDKGPVDVKWEDFDSLRARVKKEWTALPKKHDPVSAALKDKITEWIADYDINYKTKLAL